MAGRDARLLIMQNHGAFFAGESIEEVRALVRETMDTLLDACPVRPDCDGVTFDSSAAAETAAKLRALTGSFVSFGTNAVSAAFCESR